MSHPLAPLLAPRSIAFVGASPRPDTVGSAMLQVIERGGFGGRIFPVNPKYDKIGKYPCWPSMAALPEQVDLAVLAVANPRLEMAVVEAIAAESKAAVIFASGYLEGDREPPLTARIARLAQEAGMPICGGNGMGFYNDVDRVWVGAFPTEREATPGVIAFISHSGSPYGALAHNDPRFTFNLVVSAGQELTTTVADYMDYALEQSETRVIGLYLESVRNSRAFTAALEKAARKAIPVVVLKVGRTAASAAMAISHTGALAGDDAAYTALFEHYGVLQVETLDELAASLLLFGQPRRPAAGQLVAIGDSGGEREMIVDLAARAGVTFASLEQETLQRLDDHLEHGLEPANPLDAWGTGDAFVDRFAECFAVLLSDPNAALGVFFNDLRDDYYVHDGFVEAAERAFARTGKPVAYASNFSRTRNTRHALSLTRKGIPVLDGTVPALIAVRNMLAFRDFQERRDESLPAPSASRDWRAIVNDEAGFDEQAALQMLADYGIASLPSRLVASADDAVDAARAIGYPAVLKTAMGILHKTEMAGVKLRLGDADAVRAAYAELASRLGPRVLVTRMAPAGVELALGARVDPQFGPVVMVAAGGIWIEILRDARHALAPFGVVTARRLIDRLRLRPLLDGARGEPPADIAAVAEMLSRFSLLAHDLRGVIAEIDVNPLLATPNGVLALDVLVMKKYPNDAAVT